MKDFIEDYFSEIIILALITILLIVLINNINTNNKERIAIINNTKENVKKFEKCERIDNYYYCWSDIN